MVSKLGMASVVRLVLYLKDEGAGVWPRGGAMPQRNWLEAP
jgi:hypothetical protein